jgi:transcription initiation factor IIE alpha subunit
MKNILSHLLAQQSYWRLSKVITDKLGLLTAFALTDLIDKYDYHSTRDELEDGKWFFYKREDIEKKWKVGVDTQRRILKELEELKLISYESRGAAPKKNYYTVNENEIAKLFKAT